jgi:sugar phosphate isomerase/epimerase
VEASFNFWWLVLLVIGSAVVGSMNMSICSSCPLYPCTQDKISRCFFEIGFRFLEIRIAFCDDVKALKKVKADCDLDFGFHAPYLLSEDLPYSVNLCSANPEMIKKSRQWMEKTFRIAQELDGNYVVIHPDYVDSENLEEGKSNFVEMVRAFSDSNVEILIENLFNSQIAVFPEQILELIEAIDSSNVNALWDVGHSIIASKLYGLNLLDFPRVLGKKIRAAHLHGVEGDRDHLPFRNDNLPVKPVCQLKNKGFKGPFVLEIIPDKMPEGLLEAKNQIEKITCPHIVI